MNRHKSFMLLLFFVSTSMSGQNREITLEEIWNDTFKTETLEDLHSMKNGQQYSVLNSDDGISQIDIYDYKTLNKLKTLVTSADINDVNEFSKYTFSTDETKVLLATNVESIYRRSTLGKYEREDQITAVKQLAKLPYIDENNIGIWGWSYGGFMSSNALFKGNDTFSMAIAVAPVTSWRFYDTIYTERYMMTPQENPTGYDENSPINHVDKLKGDFLLIHGSGDDNVHVQNSMRLNDALVQADKAFDQMIYTDKKHSIKAGTKTRLHLYRKMTRFIHNTLGKDRKTPNEVDKEQVKIKG